MSHINSSHSTLCLSDIEKKCKQAASLKLPLSRVELNIHEVRELFQVRYTIIFDLDICNTFFVDIILHFLSNVLPQ